VLEINRYRAG